MKWSKVVFLSQIRCLIFVCFLFLFTDTTVVDAKIVFIISGDIFVMDDDGSSRRRLTKNTETKDHFPRWSHDGKRIAFVRYMDRKRRNTAELFIMNADGTNIQRLTYNNIPDSWASWSPDGKRIVFDRTLEELKVTEVHVIELESMKVTQLTGDKNSIGSFVADWSPDGSQIVYEKFIDNNDGGFTHKNLYVMLANGEQQRPLLPNPEAGANKVVMRFEPRWSADGQLILFDECTWEGQGQKCRLAILRIGGRIRVIEDIYDRLGDNFLTAGSCFMENDRAILFASKFLDKPNANYDIYRYEFENRSLRRITKSEKSEHSPDWIEGALSVLPYEKLTTQWGKIKDTFLK